MQNSSRYLSLLLFAWFAVAAVAQTYPKADGERVKLNAVIEFKRGYVSGICAMLREGDTVRSSVFNEFGISTLDFSYDEAKDKVKLEGVVKLLDKWYIRRVLRRDLRQVMHCLRDGVEQYRNERRGITYQFTPIEPQP